MKKKFVKDPKKYGLFIVPSKFHFNWNSGRCVIRSCSFNKNLKMSWKRTHSTLGTGAGCNHSFS